MTIPSGSLIVIVGANGSGKSTHIRLLARLFDPTSGDFLIDGHPAKSYNMADLRRASTILSQDNKIYPSSFAENIGLGLLQSSGDMDLITKAAEQGGATEFISKLESGYDTRLHNSSETTVLNIQGKPDTLFTRSWRSWRSRPKYLGERSRGWLRTCICFLASTSPPINGDNIY